jgi:seryl-tRNA synthetase
VLDQRLLRDNPELITSQLGRRGMDLDLTGLQLIARQERDLEQQRSDLQAEGNRIGREVGQMIRGGATPDGPEVHELRERGNRIKQQVAVLEQAAWEGFRAPAPLRSPRGWPRAACARCPS